MASDLILDLIVVSIKVTAIHVDETSFVGKIVMKSTIYLELGMQEICNTSKIKIYAQLEILLNPIKIKHGTNFRDRCIISEFTIYVNGTRK